MYGPNTQGHSQDQDAAMRVWKEAIPAKASLRMQTTQTFASKGNASTDMVLAAQVSNECYRLRRRYREQQESCGQRCPLKVLPDKTDQHLCTLAERFRSTAISEECGRDSLEISENCSWKSLGETQEGRTPKEVGHQRNCEEKGRSVKETEWTMKPSHSGVELRTQERDARELAN
eukprot:5583126-Pleurochrysis_carterae.AAC.1